MKPRGFITILTILGFSSPAKAQITASFSTPQQALCQGQCITFNNTSTGPIVAWQWEFPGGTPGVFLGPNPPQICYSAPGVFDVLLIVSDGVQVDSLRMTNYITVAQLPVLSFQTQDVSCPGITNGMAAASLSGGTGNYTYVWSPGGETTAIIDSLAPGTYTVTASDIMPVTVTQELFSENFSMPGTWTLNVATGPNDADANFWTISDAEGGQIPPACGVAFNGNPTLHVTSTFNPSGGAAYNAGGLCPNLMCVTTNRRAESPLFSTAGYSNVFISFHYIMKGQAGVDQAQLFFHDGISWQPAPVNIPVTSTCPSGQGLWSVYVAPLPPNCQNNPNVRIAFNWQNNDDGIGTDPSFAVDDIRVYNLTTFLAQCSITDSVVIQQLPGPQLSFTIQNPGCSATDNGSISVQVQNAQGGLSYQWWPVNGNGPTLSNLPAGTYAVTVYDTITGGVSSGGVTVWSDDFDGAVQWTLNVPFGINDPEANYWIISDAEGGMSPGNCAVQYNGNATLHITNTLTNGGALYNAGGLCPLLMCVTTHVRAESVPISTVGYSNLTLQFDFIAYGQSQMDEAAVWYNDGSGWTMISPLQSNVCAASQGLWTQVTFSLPPSCENIPNLQIGFTWRNNDDGLGADPSVAINDVFILAGATSQVTGGWVCSVSDTVTLVQLPLLDAEIQQIVPLSCGNSAILTADIQGTGGPFTIQWSGGQPTQNPDTLIVPQPGQVILTVSDTAGCTVHDTLNVLPGDGVIQLQALITQPNCNGQGGAISLIPSGGTGSYAYLWSHGPTSSAVNGLTSGTYHVQISSGGCVLDTSFTLLASNPILPVATLTQPRCHGQNSGSIKLSITGGQPPYTIVWNGEPGPAVQYYLPADTFYIHISDTAGCDTTLVLVLQDPPAITITSDTSHTIWMGESVVINSSASGGFGTLTSTWSPNYYIECLNCPSTLVYPPRTTTYTVTYTDTAGCRAERFVEVVVVRDGPHIPNTFTPNGNGINEEWRIIAYGVKEFELRIFNRWGEEIFFSDDVYKGWDGYYQGREAPQGTYVYRCQIKYLNGDVGRYMGHIVLYR
ncbi:MAG: gliding motility-associated C-terminal domain-containing protein [Flavobacteriales bacterium]|nr:gliding motility-associated C-terminal domain-containing protein [Flavobacteriales bacterium]